MTLSCSMNTPTATILAGKMEIVQNEITFSMNPGKIELKNLQLRKPFRYYITIANNENSTLEYQIKAQVPDYTEAGYKPLTDNSTYRIEIPSPSIIIEPHSEAKAEIIVTRVEKTSDLYESWIRIKQVSENQIKLEMISRLLLK